MLRSILRVRIPHTCVNMYFCISQITSMFHNPHFAISCQVKTMKKFMWRLCNIFSNFRLVITFFFLRVDEREQRMDNRVSLKNG